MTGSTSHKSIMTEGIGLILTRIPGSKQMSAAWRQQIREPAFQRVSGRLLKRLAVRRNLLVYFSHNGMKIEITNNAAFE